MASFAFGQSSVSLASGMEDPGESERIEDSFNRKCKIMCTMGPKCWDVETLLKFIDAGMNVCRLDFSHGDHEAHAATVARIREAAEMRPTKPVAILVDTRSPEIRTGFFKNGGSVDLKAGNTLKLVTDYAFKGDATCIAVTYQKLPTSVQRGNTIVCADGSLMLWVLSCGEDYVMTKVMNNCKLGECEKCSLPGVHVDLPVLQDRQDLVKFAIPNDVDFLAASFVRSEADVRCIRAVLGEDGKCIKVISKIENEAGLQNFDEILAESDGIMMAPCDLGMEIPIEKVFLAQKMMIAKCNAAGKPIIIATQMLESMMSAPRPTCAETSDVANAVLDGTDCVMLSGETASGGFPEAALRTMRRACEEAEAAVDYSGLLADLSAKGTDAINDNRAGLCVSAVQAAEQIGAKLVIVLTESGQMARLVARCRPSMPILALTCNERVMRQAQVSRGVVPLLVSTFRFTDVVISGALSVASDMGMVVRGDLIVIINGTQEACPGGASKMQIQAVPGRATLPPAPPATRAGPKTRQAPIVLEQGADSRAGVEEVEESCNRKCKIMCTMGPECWDVETLVNLMDAGMDVCRLNFSHADHEAHGAMVQQIRQAAALRPDRHVAILLDTKGPEIRTGFFKNGGTVDLKAGNTLKLVTDYSFKGDATCIAVTYRRLPTSVKPGNTILCADGSLALEVHSCGEDHVMTRVMNDCQLGERKTCILPGVRVDFPVLQERDKDDLVNFGIPHGVDFVAASFVQSGADVRFIRDVLGEMGQHIKIISKIENKGGLQNFDEILAESDGIMVARGNLGMEIPLEKVVLAQKMMIEKCNAAGKPVITATQMLESMVEAPTPTRAEALDVVNAVLDGTDCVMLSGETAAGGFPENAVCIMQRICREAEKVINYDSLFLRLSAQTTPDTVVAASAIEMAIDTRASMIVVVSASVQEAQNLARFRPRVPILAVTADARVARQLLVSRGVVPMVVGSIDDADAATAAAMSEAQCQGMLEDRGIVVVVQGTSLKAIDGPVFVPPKEACWCGLMKFFHSAPRVLTAPAAQAATPTKQPQAAEELKLNTAVGA